jgi:pimeloyl-ACP methyl ester carboxylesterase
MIMSWLTKRLPYLAIFLLLTSFEVKANSVVHEISALNLKADAEYMPGNMDKPAILFIHGFLTTHKFHTVVSMAQSLQLEGYSTLSPTLTLNIPQRKSSLKCNSMHTHTLERDVVEMTEWIQYLHDKGHKKIIVVGHSSGSQELIELLKNHKNLGIEAAIFTSLFYFTGEEFGTLPNEVASAQKALKEKRTQPNKYSFLFCKNNYYATPESFLSYLKLDRQYTLDALKNLAIPSYTIMGGSDKRYQSVGENWLDELDKTGTHLIVIEGANHFFSSQHEFDLQDKLIQIIKNF